MTPINFRKVISPDFDRLEIVSMDCDDWLTLTMQVGRGGSTVSMTLRSEEAIRDLHYALQRYISLLDAANSSRHGG